MQICILEESRDCDAAWQTEFGPRSCQRHSLGLFVQHRLIDHLLNQMQKSFVMSFSNLARVQCIDQFADVFSSILLSRFYVKPKGAYQMHPGRLPPGPAARPCLRWRVPQPDWLHPLPPSAQTCLSADLKVVKSIRLRTYFL